MNIRIINMPEMLQYPGGFSLKMLFVFGGLDPSLLDSGSNEPQGTLEPDSELDFSSGQFDTLQNLPYT